MDERLAELVWDRAGAACEYCRLPADFHPGPFEIEHVIPKQHGGKTTPGNLALACLRCNRHKGPNLAGFDPATSRRKLIRRFNPRRHLSGWHFRWDGPILRGRTAIGRATIEVLAMNEATRVELRGELLEEGVSFLDD